MGWKTAIRQHKIYMLILVMMIFPLALLLKMYYSVSGSGGSNKYVNSQLPTNNAVKPPKLILFYNTLFGYNLWPGFETTERFNNWGGIPCKIQNCRVTYNKKKLSKADVVIFHAFGSDMISQREIEKLQAMRNPNSFWIYFLHESPANARPDPYLYDGYFNWTMTYRRDSDIVVPYNWEWGTWEKRGINDAHYRHRNYAAGKDKLLWGAISHCGCLRESYIRKLSEYIPIDIYGKCGKSVLNRQLPECIYGSDDCKKLISRYKFFLAFENSFCVDYISEKYAETLFNGHSIPIVMGGGYYKEVGMPHSYIDVNDFDTIEDLANYIKYLDDNDDEFNKYFEFRRFYKLGKPRSWSCTICEMINFGEMERKIYYKLGDWHAAKNSCGIRLERLQQILHNSDVPRPYTDEYNHYELF